MMAKRWQTIKEILWQARSIKGVSERRAFLKTVCASKGSLQAEIEALLSHEQSPAESRHVRWSLIGKHLAHYLILKRLAVGSMGAVYKALDTHLRRTVALKVLSPGLAGAPDVTQRFLKEARCAALLNHPNIVTIYDVTDCAGLTFIAMEYVEGKTLDRVLPSAGLPVSTALDYALQLAGALEAAHSARITHRDLKPTNLIVTKEGQMKVFDFGLAKAPTSIAGRSNAKTFAGTILGTAGYMAPEQVRSEASDDRSDIFSFGAILYEMLSGQRAFKRAGEVETMGASLFTNPPSFSPEVPQCIANVVWRCLEKEPKARYQTVTELIKDLQTAASELRLGELPIHVEQTRDAAWQRRRFRAILAGSLLFVASVFLVSRQFRTPGAYASADELRDRPQSAATSTAINDDSNDAPARAQYFQAPLSSAMAGQPDIRFHQALDHQSKADAVCFQRSNGCDVTRAITELKATVADLEFVLRARPHHTASLWNKGLAYSSLCELQSRTANWSQAISSCDRALADLGEALKSGRRYDDLPTDVPDEAAVIWNRGLTHRLRGNIAELNTRVRITALNSAIADFDHILNGGAKYAAFQKKKNAALVQYRARAADERSALVKGTGKD
jgi:serine/threonine protein kinase